MRLRAVLLVAVLAVAAGLLAAPAGAVTFTDSNFDDVTLAGGLTQPTIVTWVNGHMLVAQKDGVVRDVLPNGNLSPTPLLDISDHVFDQNDRGLLGMAYDGNATPKRLYLLYTWGQAPANHDPAAQATSALTWVALTDPGGGAALSVDHEKNPTETSVLGSVHTLPCPANSDCLPSESYTHSIGTVRVDPNDQTLWVGNGDGTDDDAAHPQALRTYDDTSLSGKILHIHKDGTGFLPNSHCTGSPSTSDNCSKVFADGFRNPFRFTLRQVSGQSLPVVGDVGWGHWEELDLLTTSFQGGWPCHEGDTQTNYDPGCVYTPTDNHPTTNPVYEYSHYSDECRPPISHPMPCNQNNIGSAIVGGPEYHGTASPAYPASYTGKVFTTDYVHGYLRAIDPANLNADPAQTPVTNVASPGDGIGHAVDLEQAPDGDLVYVDIGDDTLSDGSGAVHEIRYDTTNHAPVPRLTASKSCGAPGLTVNFTGDASSDPDPGDAIASYAWDFGDGTTSTQADPSHQFSTAGDYQVRLKVTDLHGVSNSAFVAVSVHDGATAPTPHIDFPPAGSDTRDGIPVADPAIYAYIDGEAVDVSGGSNTSDMTYEVLLNHGGTHVHPGGDFPSPSGDLQFTADSAHDADSWYVVRLVAKLGGCVATKSIIILPVTAQLTLQSDVPGGSVTYTHTGQDNTGTTPRTFAVAKNVHAMLTAPQTVQENGWTYTFKGWSDGPTSASRSFIPGMANTQSVRALYNYGPPKVSITSPDQSFQYHDGTQVTLNGQGTDARDGALAGSALSWVVKREHGSNETSLGTTTGGSRTFTPSASDDATTTYVATLTATGTDGQTSSTSITVHPATSQLSLTADAPGVPLTYSDAGQHVTGAAPRTVTVARGGNGTISAPATFKDANGFAWTFTGWSDGPTAASRPYTATDTAQQTVRAHYRHSGPQAKLTAPAPSFRYTDGTAVTLKGTGRDATTGALPGSSLTWMIVRKHGSTQRSLGTTTGASRRFTPARSDDARTRYAVVLTVRGADGQTARATMTLAPRTAPVALSSTPKGARLTLGGAALRKTTQIPVGFRGALNAPATFKAKKVTYRFKSWSDRKSRKHTVTVPRAGLRLTASFRRVR